MLFSEDDWNQAVWVRKWTSAAILGSLQSSSNDNNDVQWSSIAFANALAIICITIVVQIIFTLKNNQMIKYSKSAFSWLWNPKWQSTWWVMIVMNTFTVVAAIIASTTMVTTTGKLDNDDETGQRWQHIQHDDAYFHYQTMSLMI
jgi:hypothetical protein